MLGEPHQVASGIASCRSVLDLAREYDVRVPFVEQSSRSATPGGTHPATLAALMQREAGRE